MKREALNIISRIINSGRLNELGVSCFEFVWDRICFSHKPERISIVNTIHQAKQAIKQRLLLSPYTYMGYLTGGLELGMHHVMLIDGITLELPIRGMVLGLEPDEYIYNKGREPLFTLPERILVWSYVLPSNSIIVTLPSNTLDLSSNAHYDNIAFGLGIYRNARIVYMGDADDPQEIKNSRRRRAYSNAHIAEWAVGLPQLHISELLK